jgi:hypothetical protein
MSSKPSRKATSADGHVVAHQLLRFLEIGCEEGCAIDPEAERGFAPAVAQEMAEHLEFLEAAQEHFLVVAREDSHAPTRLPFARQRDDPRAVDPPVNQVAEQDDGGVRGLRGRIVGIDRGGQRLEQVAPSVDVAHCSRPLPGRDRRLVPCPPRGRKSV